MGTRLDTTADTRGRNEVALPFSVGLCQPFNLPVYPDALCPRNLNERSSIHCSSVRRESRQHIFRQARTIQTHGHCRFGAGAHVNGGPPNKGRKAGTDQSRKEEALSSGLEGFRDPTRQATRRWRVLGSYLRLPGRCRKFAAKPAAVSRDPDPIPSQ
jgi:hypothetical protein